MKKLSILLLAGWIFYSCASDVTDVDPNIPMQESEVRRDPKEGHDLNEEEKEDRYERLSPPASATKVIQETKISINYSSPGVKNRKIWGELVPYNKVWRTGANEATVIDFSKDVSINGNLVPAGKYALFTIPGKKDWTIIINSEWDQWGAFKYDESKDVLRIKAEPWKNEEFVERLIFYISDEGEVILDWENLSVSFKVDFL